MSLLIAVVSLLVAAAPALAESSSMSQTTVIRDGVSITTTTKDGATTTTTSDAAPSVLSGGSLTTGGVAARPLDAVSRYFDLDESQEKQRQTLRGEYSEARRAAIAEVDRKLKADYTTRAAGILAAEHRNDFRKIMELIAAYEAEVATAQDEFSEVVKAMGGDGATVFTYQSRPEYMVHRTPGLTDDERKAVREVSSRLSSKWYKEVQSELRSTFGKRPRMSDRDEWRAYSAARRELRQEVFERHREELIDGLAGAMSPASAGNFRKLVAAADTLREKRLAARGKLQKAIAAIIGPERAKGI
jgi:hypothetical protein